MLFFNKCKNLSTHNFSVKYLSGFTGVGVVRTVISVFGNNVVSEQTVKSWFKKSASGDFSFEI